jgi:plasmid stabilization system protein ParE
MSRRFKPYQLSHLAKSDLESIYDYTLETCSKKQADKYIGKWC